MAGGDIPSRSVRLIITGSDDVQAEKNNALEEAPSQELSPEEVPIYAEG